MFKALIPVVLLGLSGWQYLGDRWWSGWFSCLFVFCFLFSSIIAREIHWTAGLCSLSTLISSLLVFGWKYNEYAQYGGRAAASFDNLALYGGFSFLAFSGLLIWTPKEIFKNIESGFALSCLFNSTYVLYQYFHGVPEDLRGGFMGNPSMNATFIAMTYPMLVFRPENNLYNDLNISFSLRNYWFHIVSDLAMLAIPVVAIFMSSSSVPIGVLTVCIGAYVLNKYTGITNMDSLNNRIYVATFLCLAILLAGLTYIPDFINSHGRFSIWKITTDWWIENANHMTGMGNGSYVMWGPHIQDKYNVGTGSWYIWTHNDWLQVLFEQGYLGLFSFLLLFLYSIKHTLDRPHVNSAILAYGAASFFNFPAHFGITAFYGMFLVRLTFSK